MNRTGGLILVSVLTMAIVVGGSSMILSALAEDKGTAPNPQLLARESPWMSQLTDDQKEQIQALIQSLRESGAPRQEVGEAINAKLQEWGIELPASPQGQEPPWMSQLTEEQKAELQQLLDSLRESGATPEETRDAINAKLQEWGIEAAERVDRGQRLPPCMSQLDDEQKEQIQQLVESLRESGATQHQIRDAVRAQLQQWGIEVPAPPLDSG